VHLRVEGRKETPSGSGFSRCLSCKSREGLTVKGMKLSTPALRNTCSRQVGIRRYARANGKDFSQRCEGFASLVTNIAWYPVSCKSPRKARQVIIAQIRFRQDIALAL